MALTSTSDLLCLVCNTIVDLNCCTNIFYISLPHNGNTLADFIMKVLKLSPSDIHCPYLCMQCYNLFEMLEQAQWTATNIECEIFKVFKNNSKTKQEVTEQFYENEGLNQTKINIINYLSEKDLTSLNDTSSQIASDAISNEVEIKCNNVSYVITTNEKSYTSEKKCSPNKINQSEVDLNDAIPIFSDEIIKNPSAENLPIFPWQETNGTSILQNSTDNNENLQSDKPEKRPITNPIDKVQKIIGGSSKYSQKPLKHSCPACGKKWRTSTELKTHMGSHSSVRPYMCEKCGRGYKHKQALEIHVGMHSGVSPFRCSYCDKCFTQKGALQRHLPMHTGETPYQCELCGKRFVHHTSYNMHVLSHTGKKSYTCHICDLSLLSTSHLKRHMRVHTGEKPYSCGSCGKSFAERYNLQAHVKIHDPHQMSAKIAKRNQHKCNQCGACFSKKQMLKEHSKQLHADDEKNSDNWLMDGDRVDLLETCVNEVWQSLSKSEERLKVHDNVVGLSTTSNKHYECV